MSIFNYFIGIGNIGRTERSSTQMIIDKLITKLKTFPDNKEIKKLYNPHSYRGYYSDLALQISDEITTVSETIKFLYEHCLDETYRGYKGGNYTMDKDTPLFIAAYGNTGKKFISIIDGDILNFETEWES